MTQEMIRKWWQETAADWRGFGRDVRRALFSKETWKEPAKAIAKIICYGLAALIVAGIQEWATAKTGPQEERDASITVRWQDCRRIVHLAKRPEWTNWEKLWRESQKYTCADGSCALLRSFQDSCEATVYPDVKDQRKPLSEIFDGSQPARADVTPSQPEQPADLWSRYKVSAIAGGAPSFSEDQCRQQTQNLLQQNQWIHEATPFYESHYDAPSGNCYLHFEITWGDQDTGNYLYDGATGELLARSVGGVPSLVRVKTMPTRSTWSPKSRSEWDVFRQIRQAPQQ
jgi:hypothetical protein